MSDSPTVLHYFLIQWYITDVMRPNYANSHNLHGVSIRKNKKTRLIYMHNYINDYAQ